MFFKKRKTVAKAPVKKEWVNPQEYTVMKKSGTSCIRDECVHDKDALEQLRLLVCPTIQPEDATLKTLIVSAESRLSTMSKHADKFYASAIAETDVDLFFKDLLVVQRDINEAADIEKYVYYGGMNANIRQYNLNQRQQIETRHLIDRAYTTALAAPDPADIASNQLSAFKRYSRMMDDKTKAKLLSKYKKYLPDNYILK